MTRHLLPFACLFAFAPSILAAPKHVVLLVADDLGMQVSCYGDKAAKTPNIDKLAAAGTRFTHGFASVSSFSPSRATLLTGMPTHMCGQYGLAHADHNAASFKKVKGLPALLAPAGYRSAAIAKLHVQPKEVYPFEAVPWAKPDDLPYDGVLPLPKLGGPNGTYVPGFADGSVRTFRRGQIDEKNIRYLISIADGNVVNIPDR